MLNSRFFREKYEMHFKLLFYILPSMLSNNYIPELLTEVLFICVEALAQSTRGHVERGQFT